MSSASHGVGAPDWPGAWRGGAGAAILFDFGGTLDAVGVTWRERFSEACRAEGLTVSPDRFDAAFYASDDALVGQVPVTLSLRDTLVRLATGLTRALGCPDADLADRIATRILDAALRVLRGHAPLLDRLARRYRLGVVSNFYGNLAAVCRDGGIDRFCTVLVDSACVGVRKPDPRIFRHALDALRLAPRDAVFVGDSATRDMAGARGVGMPHAWLVRRDATPPPPCCPGDPVIGSLDELEKLLP